MLHSCDLRLDCNDARGWWKELLLECLGTALYVSVVATADTTAAGQPFVSGATLIGLLYMVQEATKDGVGHFNPAVTAGFALTGEISVILSLLVIAAQFVGGILGGLLAWMFVSEDAREFGDLGWNGVPGRLAGNRNYTTFNAIMLEFFLSFMIVLPFYALYRKARQATYKMTAPLAIGLFTQGLTTAASRITGSVFNPAYVLGVCVIAGEFDDFLLFLLVPFAGMMLGVFAYKALFVDEDCFCCTCEGGDKGSADSAGDYTYASADSSY